MDILSPNGGEEWKHGNAETITWRYQELPDNAVVELELRQNGTTLGSIIDPAAPVKPVLSNESFTWIKVGTYYLPDGTEMKATPGVDFQIYIKTAKDAGIPYTDESDNFFTISGFILLTPNGGEIWDLGKEYEINWQTVGTFANISIQYSIDGGNVYDYLLESDVNSGTFLWSIPWDVLPDSQVQSDLCMIRISDAGLGVTADTSDNIFTIIRPTITVSTPNGFEEWEGGSVQTIIWESTGNIDNVLIQYSINGGATWANVSPGITANDGSHSWTVPNTPSNNCLVKISDANDSNVSDSSDNPFTILEKRTVHVTSPNGGEAWDVGSKHNITWTSTGPISSVKIEYTTNNGGTWKTVTSSTLNDGVYLWTVPNHQSGKCLVKVSDPRGSAWDVSNNYFSIGTAPSVPVIISPAPGTYVPTTTPLLQWVAVSGATQYQVVISYTSVNDEPLPAVHRINLSSNTTQYRVPAGILNANTTYVWGVKAKNALGWGGWSSDRNMTIRLSSPWIYTPSGSDVWKVGREYKTKWIPDAGSPLRMELHHVNTGYVGTCLGTIGDDGIRGWTVGDFKDGGFPGGTPQAGKVYFIKLVVKNPDHAVRGYSQTQFNSREFTITQ